MHTFINIQQWAESIPRTHMQCTASDPACRAAHRARYCIYTQCTQRCTRILRHYDSFKGLSLMLKGISGKNVYRCSVGTTKILEYSIIKKLITVPIYAVVKNQTFLCICGIENLELCYPISSRNRHHMQNCFARIMENVKEKRGKHSHGNYPVRKVIQISAIEHEMQSKT